MYLVTAFNPTAAKSGSFIAPTLQTGSKMIVINKSYVDMQFTFSNGFTLNVIANDRRGITFGSSSSIPNNVIQWAQINIDYPQTVNQLENVVYVELYDPYEVVAEQYPQGVVRETLPNILPYDIGHGLVQFNDTALGTTRNVFSTNYWSFAVAPISGLNGLGFDHFYLYQNVLLTTMADIPGIFAGTGKTGNNATPNNVALMSYIPGPFSLMGLTPVDTGTFLNNTFWTLSAIIPWASSTSGFYIEAWINPSKPSQQIMGDDNPVANGAGLEIVVNSDYTLTGIVAFVGGNGVVNSTMSILPNTWTHVALQYTGTTTNTLLLYINGQQVAVNGTSGAPVNTTHNLRIGGNAFSGGSWLGGMAYIGILLSSPGTGQGTPAARYEHGLQSLNKDYQRGFVTGISFDLITGANPTASPTALALGNIFNPGGLLYAQTPAAADQLHIYNLAPGGGVPSTQRFIYNFGAQAANLVQNRFQNFPQPVLTYNTSLHSINGVLGLPAGVQAQYNVYGYNLLGIA